MSDALDGYPHLGRVTALRHHEFLAPALRSAGVDLGFAERLAMSALDYETLEWVRRFEDKQIGTSPLYPFASPLWTVTNDSFVKTARAYQESGLSPRDFTPYISPSKYDQIEGEGFDPRVLGFLTRGGMYSDFNIVESALAMPREFSEMAMAMDVPLATFEELHKAGLEDPYSIARLGPAGCKELERAIWNEAEEDGTGCFEDSLARMMTFPRRLWNAAFELRITAEMAARVKNASALETKDDILAAVFPDLPRDYAIAML